MLCLKKAYLEITNICNLNCAYCPKTRRQAGFLSPNNFKVLAQKLRPYIEYLYLHLMGEPLLHPELEEILACAGTLGFKVMITTNGTLLKERQSLLCTSPAVKKVSISLHSFEWNSGGGLADYLTECIQFVKAAATTGTLCALRLWNLEKLPPQGTNIQNEEILAALKKAFPEPWQEGQRGITLSPHVFLELGERFEWPSMSSPDTNSPNFCYGLRDQVGILWDGTIVPCCLDHEGDIPLGNLYSQTLEEVLNSPRARAIYDGFSHRQAVEELCRRCGFARRFK